MYVVLLKIIILSLICSRHAILILSWRCCPNAKFKCIFSDMFVISSLMSAIVILSWECCPNAKSERILSDAMVLRHLMCSVVSRDRCRVMHVLSHMNNILYILYNVFDMSREYYVTRSLSCHARFVSCE
jgi:hypothetical protein